MQDLKIFPKPYFFLDWLVFLTSILHASVSIAGLIEGVAEATASITKFLFGLYSDYLQKRKSFVVAGYSFGAFSKILIGLSYVWPLVLFARFIDRLGKGMRTAARHSLGAVFGPLIAIALSASLKENIRLMFYRIYTRWNC